MLKQKYLAIWALIGMTIGFFGGTIGYGKSGGTISTDLLGPIQLTVPNVAYNDIVFQANSSQAIAVGGSVGGDVSIGTIFRKIGASGSSTRVVDFGGIDTANAVSLTIDGGFVVVGDSHPGDGNSDILVARFAANASLDTTFNGSGYAITDVGGRPAAAFTVQVLPNNQVVVGGRLLGGASTDAFVARYNSNGTLDSSFGTNGIVIIDDAGASNLILDLYVNSTVTAAGVSGNNMAVYRLKPNGSLDTTFSGDGKVGLPIPGGAARANAIIAVENGSVIGGSAVNGNQTAIAKLLSNGSIDPAFGGGDGITALDLVPGAESIVDLESWVVGGEQTYFGAFSTIGGGPGAVRFKENGSLDYRFGASGYARHPSLESITTSFDLFGGYLWVAAFRPGGAGTITALDFHPSTSTPRDFDGDGNPDTAVFRPSSGTWYILRSSDSSVQVIPFGGNGDIPVDGDFDGDGKADAAIYRPSLGQWWILRSSDGTNFAASFGTSTDKPVATDYDKDGKTDIAVWRPSNGNYLILRSSENFASFYGFPFGTSGDIPVGSSVAP